MGSQGLVGSTSWSDLVTYTASNRTTFSLTNSHCQSTDSKPTKPTPHYFSSSIHHTPSHPSPYPSLTPMIPTEFNHPYPSSLYFNTHHPPFVSYTLHNHIILTIHHYPIVMPIISHSSSTLLTHMGLMPTHFSSYALFLCIITHLPSLSSIQSPNSFLPSPYEPISFIHHSHSHSLGPHKPILHTHIPILRGAFPRLMPKVSSCNHGKSLQGS